MAYLPPTYEQITSLGNGLFASYLRDSITLYIKDSTSLTAHLQDNFSSVKAKNGLLFIEQNDKIGVFYYNQKLRTISLLSPFNFDSVESTKKYHHVIVKKKNKYGLYSHDIINNEFILRIPIKYDYISLSGSRNFYAVKRFTQNKERVIRYKYSRKQKKVILKEKFWRTRDQY